MNHMLSPNLFRPDPKYSTDIPSVFADRIPRYLFRVYNPKSMGKTSDTLVASPAPRSSREDIFDTLARDRHEAFHRLNKHLWGDWNDPHEEACNLMSWTSSLLIALLYGIFLAQFWHVKYSDVKLLILDTRGIAPGTFVKDTEILNVFVESGAPRGGNWDKTIPSLYGLRQNGFCPGEYLSQGEVNINGQCAEASFRRLMDCGLAELYPWLFDGSLHGKWAKRAQYARVNYCMTANMEPDGCVQRAINIAQRSFEDRWWLPAAAMFLGLVRRPRHSEVINSAFKNAFPSGKPTLVLIGDVH